MIAHFRRLCLTKSPVRQLIREEQTAIDMRSDIHKGAKFPDYELPDQEGEKRKLSELQGQDPVALMLARGGYCPKEDLQHQ